MKLSQILAKLDEATKSKVEKYLKESGIWPANKEVKNTPALEEDVFKKVPKESIKKINAMIEQLEKINAQSDTLEVDEKVEQIAKKHAGQKISGDDVIKYAGELGLPPTVLMIKLKEKGVYSMTYEDVVAMYFIDKVEEEFKIKAETKDDDTAEAESPLQEKYQDYFEDKMDKHDIESPTELEEEEKKDFFEDVKKGWKKGEGPKAESSIKIKDILARLDEETKQKVLKIIKAK